MRRRQVRIREGRNDTTGGEADELDEGLVDLRVVADLPVTGEHTRVAIDFVAKIHAQQAVLRHGTVIHVQAAAGTIADRVLSAGERLDIKVVGANVAVDLQAAVSARDVDEAGPIGRAATNILDRLRAFHWQIGSLRPAGHGY